MSGNFDWLMRGKMYCKEQVANSKEFDDRYDGIQWDKNSKLVEIEEKGNHRQARNFTFKKVGD